jgi:hypothetical protein
MNYPYGLLFPDGEKLTYLREQGSDLDGKGSTPYRYLVQAVHADKTADLAMVATA